MIPSLFMPFSPYDALGPGIQSLVNTGLTRLTVSSKHSGPSGCLICFQPISLVSTSSPFATDFLPSPLSAPFVLYTGDLYPFLRVLCLFSIPRCPFCFPLPPTIFLTSFIPPNAVLCSLRTVLGGFPPRIENETTKFQFPAMTFLFIPPPLL